MPRVYLSGPISSPDPAIQERNVEIGIGYEELLKAQGLEVFCPHRVLRDAAKVRPYRWLMTQCFRALRGCDVILLLEGWESSRGASWEAKYASMLNRIRPGWITTYTEVSKLLKDYA